MLVTIPKIIGTLKYKKFRTVSFVWKITKILLRVIIHGITNKLRDDLAAEEYSFVAEK